jgi:hypothetical protein
MRAVCESVLCEHTQRMSRLHGQDCRSCTFETDACVPEGRADAGIGLCCLRVCAWGVVGQCPLGGEKRKEIFTYSTSFLCACESGCLLFDQVAPCLWLQHAPGSCNIAQAANRQYVCSQLRRVCLWCCCAVRRPPLKTVQRLHCV